MFESEDYVYVAEHWLWQLVEGEVCGNCLVMPGGSRTSILDGNTLVLVAMLTCDQTCSLACKYTDVHTVVVFSDFTVKDPVAYKVS